MTAVSICVIGLVLIAVGTPAPAAGAAGQPSQPETDNTVTRIHVYPNGSAQWTIQIRTRLDTADRVDEYEAFQDRFRENTSRYLTPFRDRMRTVVGNAANATGREMRAVNVTAATSLQEVPRRWGIVTYRFRWTNFAAQQNETLVVGDVFQGGFFLAANDTLELEAPTGYELARVEPTPATRDDGQVTWVGRTDFANQQPRVRFAPTMDQAATGPDQASPRSSNTDEWVSSPFGAVGLGVVLSGSLLLGLVCIGAYTVWRRRDGHDVADPPTASPDADSTAPTQMSTGQDVPSDEPTTEAAVLTEPEQVQNLLEANDGRLHQAAIADEFDWSASKTSRTIGNMVEDGTVEKLRLGRENLIMLADE